MAGSANQPCADFDDENSVFLTAGASEENRLDELVGVPASSACIDLLKPIAAIRALAETLQSGALNDKKVADQFLTLIIAEADRMAAAAKALLPLCDPQSETESWREEGLTEERNEAHVDNANSI